MSKRFRFNVKKFSLKPLRSSMNNVCLYAKMHITQRSDVDVKTLDIYEEHLRRQALYKSIDAEVKRLWKKFQKQVG